MYIKKFIKNQANPKEPFEVIIQVDKLNRICDFQGVTSEIRAYLLNIFRGQQWDSETTSIRLVHVLTDVLNEEV